MSSRSSLPIADAAKGLLAFVTRAYTIGFGPRDRLAGKRPFIELSPTSLAKWGRRRKRSVEQAAAEGLCVRSVGVDRRTWQRALHRLVDAGKLEVVGRGPRGSYQVRPVGVTPGQHVRVTPSVLSELTTGIGAWTGLQQGGQTPQTRRRHAADTPQTRRSQVPGKDMVDNALPAIPNRTLDSGLNDSVTCCQPNQLERTLRDVQDSAFAKGPLLSGEQIQELALRAGIELPAVRRRRERELKESRRTHQVAPEQRERTTPKSKTPGQEIVAPGASCQEVRSNG